MKIFLIKTRYTNQQQWYPKLFKTTGIDPACGHFVFAKIRILKCTTSNQQKPNKHTLAQYNRYVVCTTFEYTLNGIQNDFAIPLNILNFQKFHVGQYS